MASTRRLRVRGYSPKWMRCSTSEKRRAASGSGATNDTTMPTANDSGMVTSPGFFSGNHALLCLRISIWMVGDR